MKKIRFFLWTVFLSLFSFSIFAKENILNVYNWANYMPDDVIAQFEKETGVHVNYSTYDGNDTLYAKLKAAPNAGYDLVVPSSYFVNRMRDQGMLQKIDQTKISNFKNLNKALLGKAFDPHNEYSIPYFWGTTAIVVNKSYIDPQKVTRWADLWRPEYRNRLLILDDTHDVFSMALIALGYPASDDNLSHIQAAFLKLKSLLPNIKLFNSDAAKVNYIDEDAVIGMGYSGDTYQAWLENPNLVYIYPQEGFVIWVDCMAIPANAPHLANAYKFINFILRPDIAAKLSIEMGYASPNQAALAFMPEKMRTNSIIYPDAQTLKRAQFESDPGNVDQVYEKYMEVLKISA
jgi:spermidine/putrescine transport system substrate-binding protein